MAFPSPSSNADPATTLAEVLRNHLGMTGTKVGCDRGACSAARAWLDGEVAASCMTLALDARGRKITTDFEGLARGDELHPVQRAFVVNDALQCGFCTPGMVMSCAALVERNPRCTLDDVKQAVSGHLCRCGTYRDVFKATWRQRARAAKARGRADAETSRTPPGFSRPTSPPTEKRRPRLLSSSRLPTQGPHGSRPCRMGSSARV